MTKEPSGASTISPPTSKVNSPASTKAHSSSRVWVCRGIISPGGRPTSMIVKAPPKLWAITLWVMSKTGRWTPSCGPIKIFLLAATACSLPLQAPDTGLSYPRAGSLGGSPNFEEFTKAEVQLRITVFSRHTSVNSAATIESPTTKDYLRFPTGTFSLPNKKPAGTPRRNDDMHTEEDREGRSPAAGGSGGGGSGGGTQDDRWTEEDFKQRVRERLDTLEQHLDRIDQRLDRIEGHGEGPGEGRGGGRGGGRGEERGKGRGEERGRRRRGG